VRVQRGFIEGLERVSPLNPQHTLSVLSFIPHSRVDEGGTKATGIAFIMNEHKENTPEIHPCFFYVSNINYLMINLFIHKRVYFSVLAIFNC
jgi:hypothetical protein